MKAIAESLGQDAAAVRLLGGDDVLEQDAMMLAPMTAADVDFVGNRLEDEIGGVNLAMGMRIGDANDVPLIFEDEDVLDFGQIP